MKTTMKSILTTATLFLGLSMAAPTATGVFARDNTSLQTAPALPHTIQNGQHFLRVLNYTSPVISVNDLLPCLLTLDQTAIAHVAFGGNLTDLLTPPHGFQCTKNNVNLLVDYSSTTKFTDLNELTFLFNQWIGQYAFQGIHFEYGVGNQVYTTGDFSTQKIGDSG